MTLRHGTTLYRIQVNNPTGVCRGVTKITLDGEQRPDGVIPLRDDGAEHAVTVHLGTGI
jgi:cyclic beta-1,2-glucan synthetase